MQKIINIKINNYKHFKGRYVIYEPNGLAKEYYDLEDSLIYEGEYLNGKEMERGKNMLIIMMEVYAMKANFLKVKRMEKE